MEAIGIIGLGRMGSAMARHLRGGGFAVHGHDTDPARAEALSDCGVIAAERPGTIGASCEVVVLSLPNAEVVSEVLFGEAGLTGAEGAGVVVDTSTITPGEGRAIARRLGAAGWAYVDAPVSGGPAGAAAGALTIMEGGDDEGRRRADAVLSALAKSRIACGGIGDGQAVKLINNALVAIHLAAARDALVLAGGLGLDPRRLVEALNGSSGRSAVTEVNLPRWVLSGAFDSGFTAALMRKDVALALTAAGEAGIEVPAIVEAAKLWSDARAPDDADDFNRMAWPGEGGP